MSEETVDVLIVGAGASGAALAWSLADTRMKILCLEQGDWMDPGAYPTTSTDWELRRFGDFGLSPNSRGRPEDYPINEDGSAISVSNFNAVGGSTILYAAHFPRFRPSDFRVRTLDSVADDWPIDYPRLEPYYALNDRMMGVSGLAGDPAYPPVRSRPGTTRGAPPASTWGRASWDAPRVPRPARTSPTGPWR
jgi:choline dehydrogenase-like flavoprotein